MVVVWMTDLSLKIVETNLPSSFKVKAYYFYYYCSASTLEYWRSVNLQATEASAFFASNFTQQEPETSTTHSQPEEESTFLPNNW